MRPAQEAGELARNASPPCNQCVYGPINDSGKGWCEHPAHYRVRYEPLSGKLRGGHDRTNTITARGIDGLCGPEGLLFEGYPWWRKPFRWFAGLRGLASIYVPLIAAVAAIILFAFAIGLVRGTV